MLSEKKRKARDRCRSGGKKKSNHSLQLKKKKTTQVEAYGRKRRGGGWEASSSLSQAENGQIKLWLQKKREGEGEIRRGLGGYRGKQGWKLVLGLPVAQGKGGSVADTTGYIKKQGDRLH